VSVKNAGQPYVAVKRRFTPLDFLERQRPSGTDPYVRY
jgi:hypothetical protein